MNNLKSFVLLVINVSGLLQISLAAGVEGSPVNSLQPDPPQVPQQPIENLQPQNLPTLNPVLVNDPIKLNESVLSSLQLFLGSFGPVLYEIMTNENALGNEFAKTSQLIANDIGIQPYFESVNTIFNLSTQVDFKNRMLELLDKVSDLRYRLPDGNLSTETLGDAFKILANIFRDRESVDELVRKIKNESQAALQAAE